jgi:hypothetical protein
MLTFVNPTVRILAETILATSCDENGIPLDRKYSPDDIDRDSLSSLYTDYAKFVDSVEDQITAIFGDQWDSIDEFYDVIQPTENQAEKDFIFTRNGEGCGFWDGDWMESVSGILTEAAKKFPEIHAVPGDDGKIYLY